jgi:hypothetical protein
MMCYEQKKISVNYERIREETMMIYSGHDNCSHKKCAKNQFKPGVKIWVKCMTP